MSYNRQKDRQDAYIAEEHRKRNPRSKWGIVGWIALAPVIAAVLIWMALAGHDGL